MSNNEHFFDTQAQKKPQSMKVMKVCSFRCHFSNGIHSPLPKFKAKKYTHINACVRVCVCRERMLECFDAKIVYAQKMHPHPPPPCLTWADGLVQ